MKNRYSSWLLVGLLAGSNGSYAQQINNYLNAYVGQNKIGYLQPLADLVIAGANTGLQPSLRIDRRFAVRLNLTALGSMPTAAQKTFSATTEGKFTPQQTATAPTIVGANQSVSVKGNNGLTYVFPGGYGLARLLWAVPQISLGGIYGTEVSLRLLPYDFGDDFGKLQILGVGIRHDVGQYFLKNSPLVLNIGYAYNQYELGQYATAQSHYGYVQAGVGNSRAGAFVWAGYQTGTFDAYYSYTENNSPQAVVANLSTTQPLLGGLGGHLQLGFLSLGAGVGGPSPITGYTTLGFRFGSQKQKKP